MSLKTIGALPRLARWSHRTETLVQLRDSEMSMQDSTVPLDHAGLSAVQPPEICTHFPAAGMVLLYVAFEALSNTVNMPT